jgi:hypothetical protein
MATNGKMVDLRNLLAERFPHPPLSPLARLPTGLPVIDSQIGGGLPKGAITELVSPHLSAGSASLIAALLQAAWAGRYFLVLVDGRDSFDPHPLGNSCLRHFLWTRCTKPIEAIKAADLLLRDGNFPLVILDLVLNPAQELRKIPSTSWYRLQRLVEPTSTALLIVSRRSMVGSAQIKLVLENAWSLPTLEQANALSRLQIRVQRSQMGERAIAQAEVS